MNSQRKKEIERDSLQRAVSSESFANWEPIFVGFEKMGIRSEDIKPRENVFTFNAWRALGRTVRKGEHGVRITTFVPMKNKVYEQLTGEESKPQLRAKTSVVFHISQTEPLVREDEQDQQSRENEDFEFGD